LRQELATEFKAAPKELLDVARDEFDRDMNAKEVERDVAAAARPDKREPVSSTPFGISSLSCPVAEAVMGRHMLKLGGGESRGIQVLAARVEELRKGDVGAGCNPLIEPAAMRAVAATLEQKKLCSDRRRDRMCSELHPGVCVTDDAEAFPWLMTLHKKTIGPQLARVSDGHRQDGKALLAFLATDSDAPQFDSAAFPVKAIRLAFLASCNLKLIRGVVCWAEHRHAEGQCEFPVPVRLETRGETFDLASSYEVAKFIAVEWNPRWCFWLGVCRYDDISLEAFALTFHYLLFLLL